MRLPWRTRSLFHLAIVLEQVARLEEADAARSCALELQEQLCAEYPLQHFHRRNLAGNYMAYSAVWVAEQLKYFEHLSLVISGTFGDG